MYIIVDEEKFEVPKHLLEMSPYLKNFNKDAIIRISCELEFLELILNNTFDEIKENHLFYKYCSSKIHADITSMISPSIVLDILVLDEYTKLLAIQAASISLEL